MKTFITLLTVLVAASGASAQVVVHGMVHNADGSVPILAHAHLGKMHDMGGKSTDVQCGKDGSFTVNVPGNGLFELRVSAVSHEEVSIPLVVGAESKHTVGVDVTLKSDAYDAMPERVTMIGDWNKFAFSGIDTLAPVRKGNDYVFVGSRVATGDTLAYQLLGVAGAHSVNGSTADYYTYDGGGDYRSVMRTKPGQTVTITYDPSKMQFATTKTLPQVTFKDDPLQLKAFALYSTVERMSNEMITRAPSGAATVTKEKMEALRDYIRKSLEGAEASGDKTLTQYTAVTLASQDDADDPLTKEDATNILSKVPANSPMWAIAAREAIELTKRVEPAVGQAYRTAMESNTERSVRAIVMANKLTDAFTAKRTDEARTIYAMLKKEYKDVKDIQYEIAKYNPDAAVLVGKHIPNFDLQLIDVASKVSDKSMIGKYYLMDFWATWCGPCVREMPAIHKAYEKFRGRKGFEILSISMDAEEGNIATFRGKKWKMPWLHAFIPGIFNADVAKQFEIVGIPRPVLVGPDGIVVAMEDELRGENLEKTLAKFLGEAN